MTAQEKREKYGQKCPLCDGIEFGGYFEPGEDSSEDEEGIVCLQCNTQFPLSWDDEEYYP